MLLAAILGWGILTLWAPARWPLAVFQTALFALAAARIVGRARAGQATRAHPVALLLGAAVAWGGVQIVAGWSVDPDKTVEAVLAWVANLCAFAVALDLSRDTRERLLQSLVIFAAALAVVSVFTALASSPGKVFWLYETSTEQPTLGPFVYRNQYAAFVEAVLPLALVRAILDRRRWILYMAITALLFGSVIAAGSRAGAVLCLAEIVLVPTLVFARGFIPAGTWWRATAGTVVAAAALTATVGWQSIWNRLQEPNPYALRRELVESSLEMIRDRPVTGLGLGTWSSAYPAYAHFDDGRFVNQAHNDWVQWAAEGGAPFFLLMLGVALWSIRPALRSIWGVGLLIVFVHCLVDYPMQQRPALAAFFFALLGALAAAEHGKPDSSTGP